jgi:hypothetical protein
MVCTEHTIASKIVLVAPDGTLGDVGNLESHFDLFGDSVSVGARYVHDFRHSTIGSEIILDTPDGTPR